MNRVVMLQATTFPHNFPVFVVYKSEIYEIIISFSLLYFHSTAGWKTEVLKAPVSNNAKNRVIFRFLLLYFLLLAK